MADEKNKIFTSGGSESAIVKVTELDVANVDSEKLQGNKELVSALKKKKIHRLLEFSDEHFTPFSQTNIFVIIYSTGEVKFYSHLTSERWETYNKDYGMGPHLYLALKDAKGNLVERWFVGEVNVRCHYSHSYNRDTRIANVERIDTGQLTWGPLKWQMCW